MTAPALGALDRDVPLLIPLGAIEQHGPHLPVSTDSVLATHLAAGVHRRIPEDVVVLPTVSMGMSEHHMDFPGAITVDHQALFGYLCGILESAARHGHRKVMVLNAHGGNLAVATASIERCGRRYPQCALVLTTWWGAAGPELLAISDTGSGGAGHAGELETSMMPHVAPHLVDVDAIPDVDHVDVPPWGGSDLLRPGRAHFYRTAPEWSSQGVFGVPRAATKAKGAKAEKVIIDKLTEIAATIPGRPAGR